MLMYKSKYNHTDDQEIEGKKLLLIKNLSIFLIFFTILGQLKHYSAKINLFQSNSVWIDRKVEKIPGK